MSEQNIIYCIKKKKFELTTFFFFLKNTTNLGTLDFSHLDYAHGPITSSFFFIIIFNLYTLFYF
jgi:hypothetical protein